MDSSHEVGSDHVPGVLVGIDGSADSERAFRAGMRIAKQRNLPLRLVGTFPKLVVTDAYFVPIMTEYLETSMKETEKMLTGYAERAEQSGVEVTIRASEGDPGGTLVEESHSAELAVVGKRGRNRFAGRFLGSVSSKLAAHGHCPTLVVPQKWESESTDQLLAQPQDLPHDDAAAAEPVSQVEESGPRRYQRREFANVTSDLNFDSEVVVGVDVSDSTAEVVHAAGQAAALLDRPLTLLSAAPLNPAGHWYADSVEHNLKVPNLRQPYAAHLRESAQRVADEFPTVTVRWQFFDGSAPGVLSEASRTAALVVVGTRGHGGFAGLMLGSVSQAVLNRSVCPVLVVPAPK
ncbi:universal stress protein [Nesterenkonia natronophila]|uniref:Universal stress protein n=1 Tax=Nesterenkonia natronophila TaxID=2174932 RepID=A0A3A4G3I5_9MICC|nr:universal stress protein [Nesterenkonia natronophila]RJN32859.1 universal stress protein [Nesterenkonia natronophila]